jgi:hypothetical protein
MIKIILIIFIVVVSNSQILKTLGGDISFDTDTALMWEDQSTIAEKTWTEAIDYCNALSLGGYDDWRLPNRNELVSITDKTKYNPSIKDGFENYKTSNYWSSSTDANSGGKSAWMVNFSNSRFINGYNFRDYNNKYRYYYVRCVRGGQ